MFRDTINLIEQSVEFIKVWHDCSKDQAADLIANQHCSAEGDQGFGFYVSTLPTMTEADDEIVLEYRVKDHTRLLDLANADDFSVWRRYDERNPNMWKMMIKDGIDGAYDPLSDRICFYNVNALTFSKVYSGVIQDPLEDNETLDEIALGGLQRCTAVTVNALLKDFKLVPIRLGEVPINNPGVLRILNMKGLSYKPFPNIIGRTVQQFVNVHKMFDWYLLTPGHAMALIRGILFDAENRGPDSRKLEAAYQISRR